MFMLTIIRKVAWLAPALMMLGCVHTTEDCDNCPLRPGELQLDAYPVSEEGQIDTSVEDSGTIIDLDPQEMYQICERWLTACPDDVNTTAEQCVTNFQCLLNANETTCDSYIKDFFDCLALQDFTSCNVCASELSLLTLSCDVPDDCVD